MGKYAVGDVVVSTRRFEVMAHNKPPYEDGPDIYLSEILASGNRYPIGYFSEYDLDNYYKREIAPDAMQSDPPGP